MPHAEAQAWWAEVEHLREDLERRREAERTGFERIAHRPGGRFARGQGTMGERAAAPEAPAREPRRPAAAGRPGEPAPRTGSAPAGPVDRDPFGAVELVTPLDDDLETPVARRSTRFPRREDVPP